MRILIVDDELHILKTLTTMLTRVGHTCRTASGPAEALRTLAEQPVDLILTDLGMPGMDGLELAERIKATTPEVRIILITGWPIQRSPEALRRSGIERVITKPISRTEILSAIIPGQPSDLVQK